MTRPRSIVLLMLAALGCQPSRPVALNETHVPGPLQREFVTKHTLTLGEQEIGYTAIAGGSEWLVIARATQIGCRDCAECI